MGGWGDLDRLDAMLTTAACLAYYLRRTNGLFTPALHAPTRRQLAGYGFEDLEVTVCDGFLGRPLLLRRF